jgi:twinkle protein
VAGYKSTTFPGFTNLLKGHRKGELTVVTGPTGIGKTSVLAQLSLDFAQQGVPTLWGSFEITNVRLVKKLIQQYANKNLEKNLDDFAGAAERFSQLPLYFMRYHGGTDIDAVLDAMEYAVYVHDVEHVILDNLQFMTPSNQMKGFDKFDILDTAVARLRKFATYRNIHISLIIHPRKEDDGTPLSTASVFGSAKATQEADNVVIVQRGKTYRYLDITKNRFSGDTGKVPYSFDPESLKYTELTEEEVKKADRENRPKRGRGSAPVELEAGFGLS